jgi:(S)-sulfolactate dehydrogenase
MDDSSVAGLRADFEVRYEPDLWEAETRLAESAARCRALIVRNQTQVSQRLLDACARLEVVGRLGVGLDNIDVAACEVRGIRVIPAVGANVTAVAEYVIAAALSGLRGVFFSSTEVAAGAWPRQKLVGLEASEKTIGLVGFGAIARAIVPPAKALGMRVSAHDPFVAADDAIWEELGVEPLPLDTLLEHSDVVSLHVPLNDDTRALLDRERLGTLKHGAVLVNTSRGGIVDEPALAECLRDGHLAAAFVDVFDHEPLPAGSSLAGAPNLILTPHIAGVTVESNARAGEMIAIAIAHHLTSEAGQ